LPKKKGIHAPWEKLLDTLMLILAGGTAMNQVETLLRPDKALQWSFGRQQCAHSSIIQETRDACTTETVSSLQAANERLYQIHGQSLHHNVSQTPLLLDLDLTGLLASKRADASTKGSFPEHKGSYGRQLCRVSATPYQEILCQALLPGDPVSQVTLKPAIQHLQQVLRLSKSQRQQTLLRWDAGFGTDRNINWMLSQDDQILGKMYAHKRVRKLSRTVLEWMPTASSPGREMGVLTTPHRYARKTTQVLVRTPKKHPANTWSYGALVSTLLHLPPQELVDLYDDRGGGIETEFRSDRQGLGLSTRRKHRMAAQQRLIHLAERAHNMLMWTTHQLGIPLKQFGMLKLVRDVFQVNGYLLIANEQPLEIGLNRHHPLAYALRDGFNKLFAGCPQMKLWDPVEYIKER
jgi:hypothetical protein